MFVCVSVSVTEERQQQKDIVEITEHAGLLHVQQCPLLTTGCIEIQDERVGVTFLYSPLMSANRFAVISLADVAHGFCGVII